jgi:hypothetical protein
LERHHNGDQVTTEPTTGGLKVWLDRALFACLLLLAFSAPISIAATQTAWALALLTWIVRSAIYRPKMRLAAIDVAIFSFLGLTLASSFFSYEPEISLRKMVPVLLVTIVWLVAQNVVTPKLRYLIAGALLAGALTASFFTFGKLAVGQNLKVIRLSADSPLRAANVLDGYTILKANGIDVASPEQLAAAIASNSTAGVTSITVYRHELIDTYNVPSASFTGGIEGLGILEWSRSRDMRASGFFGHYTTFAEVLQLVASLAFGLLVAGFAAGSTRMTALLVAALAVIGSALFLTVTRASWLAFAVSATVIVAKGARRRAVLISAALAVPLAIGGLFYLQQKRAVGFLDLADMSTTWRVTVWREGTALLFSSPRHMLVGVGMDSIKNHHREWRLFDDGKLPIGHMHSNPLQIALERGIPALIAWIVWMFIYLKLLWHKLADTALPWRERGLLLGALGGSIGFLASGLVHYNWGDSEVAMTFYLIMGLSWTVSPPVSVART